MLSASITPGQALRHLRESRGQTREHLAHVAGIALATLYRVERDEVNPTRATRHVIADALKVKESEIWG